ncbi:Flp family type IVb pilin [Aestuariicella hydrocarbonica]|uniref:Flp family type IVb pilin n=1 Tax=Pseudomaricurvus hydrocarbonicus TaxID=1470433 RepID=A0A9E5T3H5_9GAMM|nr:Flp family type IVb pilin [Aestuariicella hydrocarbonica]NHO67157.1 Flp family type IVb pilin [Aestuariicella hydrocarbonica]
MTDFKHKIMDFLRDEEGLETVEYAVAGSLIVAGSVAAFTLLGDNVAAAINSLAAVITPVP